MGCSEEGEQVLCEDCVANESHPEEKTNSDWDKHCLKTSKGLLNLEKSFSV